MAFFSLLFTKGGFPNLLLLVDHLYLNLSCLILQRDDLFLQVFDQILLLVEFLMQLGLSCITILSVDALGLSERRLINLPKETTMSLFRLKHLDGGAHLGPLVYPEFDLLLPLINLLVQFLHKLTLFLLKSIDLCLVTSASFALVDLSEHLVLRLEFLTALTQLVQLLLGHLKLLRLELKIRL